MLTTPSWIQRQTLISTSDIAESSTQRHSGLVSFDKHFLHTWYPTWKRKAKLQWAPLVVKGHRKITQRQKTGKDRLLVEMMKIDKKIFAELLITIWNK